MLTADSPEIRDFLTAWHEAGRAEFERYHDRLVYDEYAPKVAKDRRKYLALNRGTGGVYLVDKATGAVYTIKAYGVPNRRIGTLADVTADFLAGSRR